MSDIRPGLFSNTSAFDSSSQMNLIPEESLEKIESQIQKVTAALDLDVESIYQRLDEALLYITDPRATRLVEDVRDEVYRNLR